MFSPAGRVMGVAVRSDPNRRSSCCDRQFCRHWQLSRHKCQTASSRNVPPRRAVVVRLLELLRPRFGLAGRLDELNRTGFPGAILPRTASSARRDRDVAVAIDTDASPRHLQERRFDQALLKEDARPPSSGLYQLNRECCGWPRTGRPAGRGAVSRDKSISASTRWGCSRTGPGRGSHFRFS
jgi:hypothetical protein